MSEDVYRRTAQVLNTLPNGFPATESGIEIKILKKIFKPEQADLFCDLKMHFETAAEIAARTGRPLEGLEEALIQMMNDGGCAGQVKDGVRSFRMIPYIIGLYEFQLDRLDRELAEMCEEYNIHVGAPLMLAKPQIMKVLPIEREIDASQMALPYRQVSHVIDSSRSFSLMECICKKEKGLLDNPCSKPTEVCMGLSEDENAFDHQPFGRVITREEAYQVLDRAEEAGLVHMTTNVEQGHWFICNCCGCCCGVLQGIKMMQSAQWVNSAHFARIDPDECTACGVCLEERCQVDAIEAGEEAYQVIKDRCIGCGLCVSTCPTEAISLVRKSDDEIDAPARNDQDWSDQRAKARGVDYSEFR